MWKTLLVWSGNQGLQLYQAWCLDPSEVSTKPLWTNWRNSASHKQMSLKPSYDLLTFLSKLDQAWYNQVQRQLALCSYLQETSRLLSKTFFYLGCRIMTCLQSTCQKPALTGLQPRSGKWEKKLKSSRTAAKHMKTQLASQSQAQVN